MAQTFITQASDFRKVVQKKSNVPMLRFKLTWGLDTGDAGEVALLTTQKGCLARLDYETGDLTWAPPMSTGPFGRTYATTEHSPELMRLGLEALQKARAKEQLEQWYREFQVTQG